MFPILTTDTCIKTFLGAVTRLNVYQGTESIFICFHQYLFYQSTLNKLPRSKHFLKILLINDQTKFCHLPWVASCFDRISHRKDFVSNAMLMIERCLSDPKPKPQTKLLRFVIISVMMYDDLMNLTIEYLSVEMLNVTDILYTDMYCCN